MSKTPYEIRLQLLEMSKDLLMQDFYTKKDVAMEKWHCELDSNKSAPAPTLANFPTEEEIIKKAKMLNSFVSNEI